jgi:hypothetical protein
MTTDEGEPSETPSYIGFVTAGQDAFAVVAFLAHFMGRMQTQNSKLADFSLSGANVQDSYCRRCRYQSTSTLCPCG